MVQTECFRKDGKKIIKVSNFGGLGEGGGGEGGARPTQLYSLYFELN